MTDREVETSEQELARLEQELVAAKRDALRTISENAQKLLTGTQQLFAAHWDARTDLIKTLISVASGAMVLSVTFSNSLLTPQVAERWKYLLIGSWVSFLASIILAIVAFWLLSEARAYPSIIVSEYSKVAQAVEAIKTEADSEHIANIPAIATLEKFRFDTRSKYMLRASLLAFVLAIVLLGVFGVKRLGF